MKTHLYIFFLVTSLFFICVLPSAQAQNDLDIELFVEPFPSPYFSDWEVNPNLGFVTITNSSDQARDVIISIRVNRQDNGQLLFTGKSALQSIPPLGVITYDATSDIGGSTDYDRAIEDEVVRTGRIPEGDFEVCVRLEDSDRNVLTDADCANFTVTYPDPPYLLSPQDEEILTSKFPIFQWTPLQVPIDYQVSYVLQIAEILPQQTPYLALTANILHHEDLDLEFETLQYPLDGLPFEDGKRYAWWVQALDPNDLPASANQGRSEIWTFVYQPISEPPLPPPGGGTHAVRFVAGGSAGEPLADFETMPFNEVSSALSIFSSQGGTLELPLSLPSPFDPITVGNITIYLDNQKEALAIRGQKEIRGKTYDVMFSAFWGTDEPAMALAVKTEGSGFESFFPIDGPMDGLATSLAFLILSTDSFTVKSANLPGEVSDYYGDQEIALRPGLNYYGKVDLHLSKSLSDFASSLGIEEQYVKFQGYLGSEVKGVFGAEEVTLDGEANLSATIPLWRPAPLRDLIHEMEGTFTIGTAYTDGTKSDTLEAYVKAEIMAKASLPSLSQDVITFTGSVELKGQRDSAPNTTSTDTPPADPTSTTSLTLELKAEDINVPALEDAVKVRELTLKVVLKSAQESSKEISLSSKVDVNLPFLSSNSSIPETISFKGSGKLEWQSGSASDSTSADTTSTKKLILELKTDDLVNFPEFEDLFKFHDLALKVVLKEGQESTKEISLSGKLDIGTITDVVTLKIEWPSIKSSDLDMTSTGGKEQQDGSWTASATFDSTKLQDLSLRDILTALWDFSGQLDALPQLPSLESLTLNFSPGDANSMTVRATTNFMNSPTHLLASRAESETGKKGFLLGLKPEDWSLTEAFPDLSLPILDNMNLSNVGLVLTNQDILTNSSDLSEEEYAFYKQVFKRDDFSLKLTPGLNLIATIPSEDMELKPSLQAIMNKLGIERGPVLLQGAISNQVEDIYLLASLPPMRPEGSPGWFNSGQVALELTGQPSVGLLGSMSVNISDDVVTFFVKTKAGKEGLILAGGLDSEEGWQQPFGIEWLVMNRVVLLLGLTLAGSVQLGFEGDMVIGDKDIQVGVITAINPVTGVPTDFGFEGSSTKGFGIADLVALQAKMVTAPALPLDNIPDIGLKMAELKFAPRYHREVGIERGMAIGGLLYMNKSSDTLEVAKALFDIGDNGILAQGDIGAFEIGPVALDKAEFDLTLTRDNQYFKIKGDADLGFMQAKLDVKFAKTTMTFDSDTKIFGLFQAGLVATGTLFPTPVFTVTGTMKNDFNETVRRDVRQAIKAEARSRKKEAYDKYLAADKAFNDAVDQRNAACDPWAFTPLKCNEKAKIVREKRRARRRAFLAHGAWEGVIIAIDRFENQNPDKWVTVKSATFTADLARLKQGQASMTLTVNLNGEDRTVSIAGWDFRNMRKSVRKMAVDLVGKLWDSQ
jgi:hypothetical protein